ncbi:DUF3892 domain-containing protein [Paenibacillus thalictri]|uniref:DUF3892 domain-containing protein n=1 Tax=Paenibacillus thalictri TaxID=2527873 RepID=A0A4Q9DN21_9BACL|nr:DUF3892 domain-containing protein [Paenibacillus thalictri]TBL75254.1 DUF3892 domain-containing protein [Paenibacillus thalictri]
MARRRSGYDYNQMEQQQQNVMMNTFPGTGHMGMAGTGSMQNMGGAIGTQSAGSMIGAQNQGNMQGMGGTFGNGNVQGAGSSYQSAGNSQGISGMQFSNGGMQGAGMQNAANTIHGMNGMQNMGATRGMGMQGAAGGTQGTANNAQGMGGMQGMNTMQSATGMQNLGSIGNMQQARDAGTETFKAGGGMPVPGSSGDANAPYGMRNTGINHADARNVGFQGGYTGYGQNGQPIQYGTFMRDGTQYGKGPHTIDPNKAIIQAVHYDNGAIRAVQFQDGSIVDINQAIAMAEAGLIEDVNTGRNREGEKTLRSYPDGDPSNNLSNLPRF